MTHTISPWTRRKLLQASLGGAAAWSAPVSWSQTNSGSAGDARLVVIFLRGAYDGLSALVPYSDNHYYQLRPNIAITAPDGSAQATIALDATFGLHPALAALQPLWQKGVLAAIPCAGSPDATRSHFEAQHHWEIGIPGKSGASPGWLNTLAGLRQAEALGVGEANPLILAGSHTVQLVPKGQAATRQGALGDARTRDALMNLYTGDDALSKTFRAGAQSRMETAKVLSDESLQGMAGNAMASSKEMAAADNGAGSAKGLLLDAQHLSTLMRQNRKLCLGFLSAGGWDTHANQGSASGTLANNLSSLAATLVQLRREFSRPNDVVAVVSEFGRTSAENGTRGTDHGHGNAVWLMGNRVQGGRWHGRWDGLATASLHEARDLPVHHDFRAVFAQVLRTTQGINAAGLDALFPGFVWDEGLKGLMRA